MKTKKVLYDGVEYDTLQQANGHLILIRMIQSFLLLKTLSGILLIIWWMMRVGKIITTYWKIEVQDELG
jgi:hypothetical protein